MLTKLAVAALAALTAFLLATNPVVADAANQITGKDIKNSSITGKDVKDDSLSVADFGGSVAGPRGPQGPKGDQGIPGPSGTTVLGHNTGAGAATNGTECTIGTITLSASQQRGNGLPANGQLVQITQNTALYSLIGTTYGGNGQTTFALPDLRAAAPDKMTYYICDQGLFPSAR